MRRPGVTIKIGPEGDREVAVIIVRETRPDEAAQAQPRDVRCDRCAVGREGDLRQLVFRGKTRYAERTVCDECAEELLELFLDTPVAAHPPAPVVRVFRARVKTGRQDAFWERLRTRSIPDLVQASGLLAYFPGEPLSESDEFVMVTVWRSFESLLAWAGDDWESPGITDGEADLVDSATVTHYSFFDAPPELLGRAS
jgi:heme-degrading monooxygenase HmoA